MKSPEEWAYLTPLRFDFIDNVQPQVKEVKGDEALTKLISEISLDGWRKGMADAVEIVNGTPNLGKAIEKIKDRINCEIVI